MKDLSKAYELVYNDLINCNLFRGIYDANNSTEDYMFGVSTVMEVIAENVADICYDEFIAMFLENMTESARKAGKYEELL